MESSLSDLKTQVRTYLLQTPRELSEVDFSLSLGVEGSRTNPKGQTEIENKFNTVPSSCDSSNLKFNFPGKEAMT